MFDRIKSLGWQKISAILLLLFLLGIIPFTLKYGVEQRQTKNSGAETFGGFPDSTSGGGCNMIEVAANDNGICPGSFKAISKYSVDFKVQSITSNTITNLQWWVYENFCGPGSQYHCSGGYPGIPTASTKDSFYTSQNGVIATLAPNGSTDLGSFTTDPNSSDFVSKRGATVNLPCGTFQTDLHVKYTNPTNSSQTCEYNYEPAAGWCETQIACTNTTPSPTPSTTPTPTVTVTPTVTNTPTPTVTGTPTITPTVTVTPTVTTTPTPTSTPGPTNTPGPTSTPTPTSTTAPTRVVTIPPTGPGDTYVGAGILGVIGTIVGAVIFSIF